MPFTIFYAWQMDRPAKVNRWFINSGIKMAIKELKAELQQEQRADDLKLEEAMAVEPEEQGLIDPEPEADDTDLVLLQGAQGQAGAGLIAETILQRIKDCGVFVADVSFVTSVRTADSRRKLFPNANVLIETGAAACTGRGWDRIILVLNNAFGDVEKLPFDLKHRRCTVQYTLKDIGDPEKGNKRKQLAKDIASEIRLMYRAAMAATTEERQRLRDEQVRAHAVRAEQVRAEFEAEVKQNRFHTFKAQAAIMALSIIPAIVPQEPVECTRAKEPLFCNYLRPFSSHSGGPLQHTPRAVVCSTSTDTIPDALTALREDGSLFAVWNMIWGRDEIVALGPKVDLTKGWLLPMDGYQPELIACIRRYLDGMKELGIGGPWYLGLSLLEMKNAALITSQESALLFGIRNRAIYQGDDMKADMIFIPEDADISTDEAVENLLKRPLKQIWKHCGYGSYPKFRGHDIQWQE